MDLARPLRALAVIVVLAFALTPAASALLAPALPVAAAREATFLDVVARADAVLTAREVQGLTPVGWRDTAVDLPFAATPRPAAADADLAAELARLHALVGVHAAPPDVRAATHALDPAYHAPFARLVHRVADAYAAQLELAERLREADAAELAPERVLVMPRGEAPRTLVDPLVDAETLAGMRANARAVTSALNAFRADVAPLAPHPPSDGSLFRDPTGLVVLAGAGDDHHVPASVLGDAVLVVDLGGNDRVENSAGGACMEPAYRWAKCNGLAVSVHLDLAGDDAYAHANEAGFAQGAGGFGALGVLVDAAGNDTYRVDYEGWKFSLQYYVQGASQGAGLAGVGVLADLDGHDRYAWRAEQVSERRAYPFALAQGYGGLGGLGVLYEHAGDDAFHASVLTNHTGTGFGGIYTLGTGIWAGVGVLVDRDGDDHYRGEAVLPQADYYAVGFGGGSGLGVFTDLAGHDRYESLTRSTTKGWLGTTLNCAYGTGWLGGVGVHVDASGDDSYLTRTLAERVPFSMAEGYAEGKPAGGAGVFIDGAGNDAHVIEAIDLDGGPRDTDTRTRVEGRGTLGAMNDPNHGAAYLDLGGRDAYVGPGENDKVWLWGADVDAGTRPSSAQSWFLTVP